MNTTPLHILIIDDDPHFYRGFRDRYDGEHNISMCKVPEEGITRSDNNWSAVIVDLDFGQGVDEGLGEVVPTLVKKANKRYPVIVITENIRPNTREIILRHGASTLLNKSELYDEKIMVAIKEIIQKNTAAHTITDNNNSEIGEEEDTHGIITASAKMQGLMKRWVTLANYSDMPVLLLGETGVGKEMAARYIHKSRKNKRLPFEAINLSGFSENLLLSELFGHVKGAFTGADKDKIGFFEKVSEGTLFIDEIGEIDETIQVQLLRVLENRTFTKVGDTQSIPLEAQLIFATNKDLDEARENGEFREDFYQRISTLQYTIPPLRERPEDIIPLINHFMSQFCLEWHPLYQKKATKAFTPEALFCMENFEWPANVRELRNEIQRLIFEADHQKAESIGIDLLSERLKQPKKPINHLPPTQESPQTNIASNSAWSSKKKAAYIELQEIENALINEGGRKADAARRLGRQNDQNLRYDVKKYYKKYPELFQEFKIIRKAYGL